jgi:hypothetical protein
MSTSLLEELVGLIRLNQEGKLQFGAKISEKNINNSFNSLATGLLKALIIITVGYTRPAVLVY